MYSEKYSVKKFIHLGVTFALASIFYISLTNDLFSASLANGDAFNQQTQEKYTATIVIGVFSTVALFNIIFFWAFNRQRCYLYLGICCLGHVAKAWILFLIFSTDTPVSNPNQYYQWINISVCFSGFFFLAFLFDYFIIPRQYIGLLAYLIMSISALLLQPEIYYSTLFIVPSFFIMGYALWKKREGAVLGAVGLVGYSFFAYLTFFNLLHGGYFAGIFIFIICVTLLTATRIQNTQLRSARLENELLKKNIQPHFIMNSLMSLQQLVNEDPKKATDMINALADEFRIFSQIADKKLINISDELAICRAHLRIMGHRKEKGFTLETQGIDDNEKIPPGVFHTLVENGVTHGFEKQQEGHFLLSKNKIENGIRYTLFNNGVFDQATYNEGHAIVSHGMGFRYIKSRLQESYPDQWALHAGAVKVGWEVNIDIFKAGS